MKMRYMCVEEEEKEEDDDEEEEEEEDVEETTQTHCHNTIAKEKYEATERHIDANAIMYM